MSNGGTAEREVREWNADDEVHVNEEEGADQDQEEDVIEDRDDGNDDEDGDDGDVDEGDDDDEWQPKEHEDDDGDTCCYSSRCHELKNLYASQRKERTKQVG